MVPLIESFVPVLFGWPFILLAVLALVAGILWKKAAWVVMGAVLSLPFSLYLAASPRFRLVALFLPLLHVAAAFAVRRDRRWLAGLLILPFLAVVAWIGSTVLNQ